MTQPVVEVQPQKTNRKPLVLRVVTAGLLGVIGFFGVLWWNAPNSTWACAADDAVSGCVAEVVLDIEVLGLLDPVVSQHGFDLAPDSNSVVVAVAGSTSQDQSDADRVVVAVFDVASGSLEQVLSDQAATTGCCAGAESVTYSADGTMVAALTYVDGSSAVELLDVSTGQVVTTLMQSSDGVIPCRGRFGLSDDNMFFQCGTAVGSIPDPAAAFEQLTNEARYADSDGSSFAWSTSGIVADIVVGGFLPNSIEIRPEAGGEPIRVIDEVDFDLGAVDQGWLSFRPDGDQLLQVKAVEPWAFFSFDGPRRSHPRSEFVFYNVADGSVANQFTSVEGILELAWNPSGALATLAADNTVQVFSQA